MDKRAGIAGSERGRRPHLRLVYSCQAFPLAGSTKEERTRAVSWALRQLPPTNEDPEVVVLRRALFDLHMIDDEREARLAEASAR